MDLIAVNANNLVRAAGLQGLVVAYGEAYRALRRYGNSYNRAYQFIERNARRNSRGDIQSRIEQKMMFRNARKRKAESLTDNTHPAGGLLKGSNITLGEWPRQTQDYLRAGKFKRMSLGNKYALRTGEFLIKNLSPYMDSLLGLSLGVQNVTSGTPAITKMYLPTYAINLTALAWQGGSNNLLTVPVYRHVKTSNLDIAAANYAWERVQLTVNQTSQPPDNSSIWQFCWNRQKTDGVACPTPAYRHMWSNIKFLLQCNNYCDCTVHTDIVQFKRECGPRRQYAMTSTNTFAYADDAPDTVNQSEIDVFWESFYARRICHPLAEYQQVEKDQFIKYHDKGSLHVNVSDNSNRPQRHLRNIFYTNGRVYNLRDDCAADSSNTGTLGNQDYKNNPIYSGDHDGYPQLTNMMTTQASVLPFNRNQEHDVWLFIHADNMMRAEESFCTFDFSVKNKYHWIDTGSTTTILPKDGGTAPPLG